jgi:hypothetical protein
VVSGGQECQDLLMAVREILRPEADDLTAGCGGLGPELPFREKFSSLGSDWRCRTGRLRDDVAEDGHAGGKERGRGSY